MAPAIPTRVWWMLTARPDPTQAGQLFTAPFASVVTPTAATTVATTAPATASTSAIVPGVVPVVASTAIAAALAHRLDLKGKLIPAAAKFMRLPAEVRMLIYECLFEKDAKIGVQPQPEGSTVRIFLETEVGRAILNCNKTVRAEALSVLCKTTKTLTIEGQPLPRNNFRQLARFHIPGGFRDHITTIHYPAFRPRVHVYLGAFQRLETVSIGVRMYHLNVAGMQLLNNDVAGRTLHELKADNKAYCGQGATWVAQYPNVEVLLSALFLDQTKTATIGHLVHVNTATWRVLEVKRVKATRIWKKKPVRSAWKAGYLGVLPAEIDNWRVEEEG